MANQPQPAFSCLYPPSSAWLQILPPGFRNVFVRLTFCHGRCRRAGGSVAGAVGGKQAETLLQELEQPLSGVEERWGQRFVRQHVLSRLSGRGGCESTTAIVESCTEVPASHAKCHQGNYMRPNGARAFSSKQGESRGLDRIPVWTCSRNLMSEPSHHWPAHAQAVQHVL